MKYDTPEDYERELARDRAEIGETIDAIQHRLSPGQLLDQALSYARASGSEAVGSVVRAAKQNPWPLLLTGVGLAWLMTSTSAHRRGNGRADAYGSEYGDYAVDQQQPMPPEYDAVPRDDREYHEHRSMLDKVRAAAAEVSRQAGEAEESFQSRLTEARARAMELSQDVGETVEAFRERVERAFQNAQDRMSSLRERASSAWRRGSDAVSSQAHHAQERMRHAGDRAVELYQAEPLIAGAIGVAAGALIGALLPSTSVEDRMLGEHGRRVRREARALAQTAAERAEAAAAEGVRAAAEAAETVARGGRKEGQGAASH